MSRVGKQIIKLPQGVSVSTTEKASRFHGDLVVVKGPKGELKVELRPEVAISIEGENVTISLVNTDSGSYQGLYRTLVANAVEGVHKGYEKELEIVGIGFKAEMVGRTVKMQLGYNVPVEYNLPDGVDAKVEDSVFVKLTGIDKQLVGETAAQIRALKKPEPYKGKGIKYKNEVIKRKAGKTAA
jgi:large subunit ribosomal protein L6